jgi:hypothetical protein
MQVDRPSSLCQNDFSGLTIPDLQQDGGCMHTLVDYDMFSGCSGSAKSGKRVSGDYVPVNFIKDEVYEMLAAFDKAALQRATVSQESDAMETTMEQAGIDFEPLRPVTDLAPPKKFYSTFWRSAVRRLLKQEKNTGITEIRRNRSSLSNVTMHIS